MLVELAIGDAYGAGFEYAAADFVAAHNTLAGYVQHPTHLGIAPGAYTDDTQMTLALAELLVDGGPWTPPAIAERFVDAFHRDPRDGYARGFQAFLREVRTGADFLARIRPDSDKSGAAMRAAPLGLLPSVDEVLLHTEVQARVTHDTPDGVASASAAALAVHYCRYDLGPVAEVGGWIADRLGSPVWARPWEGKVGSKGVMSVRAALTALAGHGSASGVLRACVAFTGDVDTVATVALAAAATSSRVVADLPAVLHDGLENGRYGRDHLARLDGQLP
ncbi:ADP-ribosylglycohydrolase family protein [Actinosynnema sp. NPDC047251]|uniref:ADP-ribosylation/Crystallin J1 n=1 Tax=Saccharothrix espanaensis (strain ATCC 51144 / DSM 44229 / JCM 9112 / NBRC 15066 / NRRL 15764) TaxID=1179773 RepID=K0K0X9_SACES|nr:ADP-ribosylglycohydrolase family protein [Saccharothrix espanaensis]CCH33890.1 ADP-ribosylation/Crystallin J1 [Saccharothrix espanaensis DSM 44229]